MRRRFVRERHAVINIPRIPPFSTIRNFLRAEEKSPNLSTFPLDVYEKDGYITSRKQNGRNKQENAS